MKHVARLLWLSSLVLLGFVDSVLTAPVIRQGSGATQSSIQSVIDQFRADLGGVNNGVGGSFTSGRREINWDGVPDSVAAPNFLAPDFFNINSPRGLVMNTLEILTGSGFNDFLVSADSNNPTNTPVRFGNIDASYPTTFQAFSGERIFTARNAHVMEVTFFIPGTKIPATVKGFGVVFLDVDVTTGGRAALIRCYAADNSQLVSFTVSAASNGFSFGGVSMSSPSDPRIARCMIQMGNTHLAAGSVDGTNGVDVIAMDDFIYGEPRAMHHHDNDFDGDGTADYAVFRPSSGTWFFINSGSNTFQAVQFGTNGDVPVNGDFDGDSRNDITVFRPSDGTWYRLNSSSGQFAATQFGLSGDKPVPGDYDRDGRTDIAVWRPSNGHYFFLRSSDGQFNGFQFGTNGDIPVGAAIAP